jgi:hypothetical protein
MARRALFADAAITRPSQTLTPPPASPPAQEAGRAPARRGKKAIAFWVEPAASTQLRVAAASTGRTLQAIMEEALDDWFRKQGLSRLAGALPGHPAFAGSDEGHLVPGDLSRQGYE